MIVDANDFGLLHEALSLLRSPSTQGHSDDGQELDRVSDRGREHGAHRRCHGARRRPWRRSSIDDELHIVSPTNHHNETIAATPPPPPIAGHYGSLPPMNLFPESVDGCGWFVHEAILEETLNLLLHEPLVPATLACSLLHWLLDLDVDLLHRVYSEFVNAQQGGQRQDVFQTDYEQFTTFVHFLLDNCTNYHELTVHEARLLHLATTMDNNLRPSNWNSKSEIFVIIG
jgi:hypothetical protein